MSSDESGGNDGGEITDHRDRWRFCLKLGPLYGDLSYERNDDDLIRPQSLITQDSHEI